MITAVRKSVVLFSVVAVALAACSSGGSQGSQDAAAPGQAGKLVIATAEAAAHLDRQLVSANGSWDTLYNITDPVVRIDKSGKVLPGLAESWEFISPTTTRLKLREDVVFSDGEKFNAEAFKISLDRLLSPESRTGESSLPTVLRDGNGVKVVDEYTVDINHEPDASLLNTMAINVDVFSPKAIKENPEGLKTKPIGSGPYRVEIYESGRLLRLVARDDYWGRELYGPPAIREVEVRLGLEPGVRLSALQSGEAQIVQGISPDDAKLLDPESIVDVAGPEVYWLRYDVANPLISDIRVRQAIDLAIDKEALTQIFAGYAKPASQLWPSHVVGWKERPDPHDLERAKTLIREAGAEGRELEFGYSSDYKANMGPVAESVAAMIEQTGLRVKLNDTDGQTFRTYMRDVTNSKPISLISLSFESFDATRGLDSRIGCGGGVSTYCNEKADEILALATAESDPQERVRLLQEYMDILDRDVAVTPLVNPPLLWAKSPKLNLDGKPSGELIAGAAPPQFQAMPFNDWTLAS